MSTATSLTMTRLVQSLPAGGMAMAELERQWPQFKGALEPLLSRARRAGQVCFDSGSGTWRPTRPLEVPTSVTTAGRGSLERGPIPSGLSSTTRALTPGADPRPAVTSTATGLPLCLICDAEFTPSHPKERTCSRPCRSAFTDWVIVGSTALRDEISNTERKLAGLRRLLTAIGDIP